MATGCLDAALELLDRGLSVIPIKPGQKRPQLASWKEFQTRVATAEEAEAWFERWPQANLALITGGVSGLWVADADGPAGVELLRRQWPTASVYAHTPGGGLHAYFALPAGARVENGVRVAPELDIRGEGGYVLVPPSVIHGRAYAWEFTEGMGGLDELVAHAPAGKVIPLGQRRGGNLELDLSAVPEPAILRPAAQGQRNATLAQLAGKWIADGLGLDETMLLAEAWNLKLCQPPLGQRELAATVRSIWTRHQRNHPPMPAPEAPPEKPAEPANGLPEALLHPGGLLGQIMAYIEAASAASHPLFNLAAAITLLGTVVGQKLMTETGLRTNFYCVCLGYSGSGKDAPHSALEALLSRSAGAGLLGPDDPTSGAAILHWLAQDGRRATLLRLDEIGLMLQACRNPQSPLAQVPAVLMRLWSATDRSYSKSYAGAPAIHIPWHHVALYGSSTPRRFWDSLTSSETVDGFLARLLVWQSEHPSPQPKTLIQADPPAELLAALDQLVALPVDTDAARGNLARVPMPHRVGKTLPAARAFAPWAEGYHRLKNDLRQSDPAASSVYGRAAEHAHKLALVHAVSRLGKYILEDTEAVDEHDVAWASGVVDALTAGLVDGMRRHVADSDWHRLEQRVLEIVQALRTPQRPGAARREIGRRLHLPSKMVKEILDSMTDHGLLTIAQHKPSRGPAADIYCLPAADETRHNLSQEPVTGFSDAN
ncbi:bifunctional DNA primase/polymerase [Desulfarculus baarsii]